MAIGNVVLDLNSFQLEKGTVSTEYERPILSPESPAKIHSVGPLVEIVSSRKDDGYKHESETYTVVVDGVERTGEYFVKGVSVNEYQNSNLYSDTIYAVSQTSTSFNDEKTSVTVDLIDPLRKIGTHQDRLFRDDDGTWKVERKITEETIDGTESWDLINNAPDVLRFETRTHRSLPGYHNVISNSFNVNTGGGSFNLVNVEGIDTHLTNGSVDIFISKERFSSHTATGFKQWLSENNVVIQYVLSTPIIETLPKEAQNILNSGVKTYDGNNYVYTNIPNVSPKVESMTIPNLEVVFKSKGWAHNYNTNKNNTDKVDKDELNETVNDITDSINENTKDKIDREEFNSFTDLFNTYQEQVALDKQKSEQGLQSALERTAVIEQTLGEGASDWIFTNTLIRHSDEGITIGREGSGSYLQISNERISFFNGSGDAVAYVSGGMLYINHAMFVSSIQIADFMVSSELPGHLTFRYVGE